MRPGILFNVKYFPFKKDLIFSKRYWPFFCTQPGEVFLNPIFSLLEDIFHMLLGQPIRHDNPHLPVLAHTNTHMLHIPKEDRIIVGKFHRIGLTYIQGAEVVLDL
jgi:hypothetical protein